MRTGCYEWVSCAPELVRVTNGLAVHMSWCWRLRVGELRSCLGTGCCECTSCTPEPTLAVTHGRAVLLSWHWLLRMGELRT